MIIDLSLPPTVEQMISRYISVPLSQVVISNPTYYVSLISRWESSYEIYYQNQNKYLNITRPSVAHDIYAWKLGQLKNRIVRLELAIVNLINTVDRPYVPRHRLDFYRTPINLRPNYNLVEHDVPVDHDPQLYRVSQHIPNPTFDPYDKSSDQIMSTPIRHSNQFNKDSQSKLMKQFFRIQHLNNSQFDFLDEKEVILQNCSVSEHYNKPIQEIDGQEGTEESESLFGVIDQQVIADDGVLEENFPTMASNIDFENNVEFTSSIISVDDSDLKSSDI